MISSRVLSYFHFNLLSVVRVVIFVQILPGVFLILGF